MNRTSRASVFHTPGWLRTLLQTYNYSPIVFTTTAPDRPLENGTAFAIVKSWLVGPRLISLPFSDYVDPLMNTDENLAELLNRLQEEQRAGRWRKVELRPPVGKSNPRWPPFHDGQTFVLQKVDLRSGLDEVFCSFHPDSIRGKIRKAVRCNVVEEVGRSDRLLRQFFALHVMTRKRQSLPPPPLAWFRNILTNLGENAKMRIALKDGGPIAAIMTLRFKETAVYKYGCTNKFFHNLGAMPLLLWNAMKEEYASGAREFDLGRSDPENEGLITFKQKLGAQCAAVAYKVFPEDHSVSMAQDWRLIWAKKLFNLLPRRVFVFAGSRIYPHIG